MAKPLTATPKWRPSPATCLTIPRSFSRVRFAASPARLPNRPISASCVSGRRCWNATAAKSLRCLTSALTAPSSSCSETDCNERENAPSAAGDLQARRSRRDRDGPGRDRPPRPRHGACHAGSRSRAAAGAARCAAAAGAPRLSLGHAVLVRRRRAGAARLGPRHRQPDRGSVRAQPDPGLCRAGLCGRSRRWRWRS